MTDMRGKIALVTGAASGIGEATARVLEKRGAHILHADLAPRSGENWYGLDVAVEAQWIELLEDVTRLHGGVDILVNAAGVSLRNDVVDTCTEAIWSKTIAVNLDGTFLGCKHVVPSMRDRGGGAIINFGSVLSQVGHGEAVAYVASKGGVRLLTKSVALYCAKFAKNIRCNVVCPGYIETRMLTDWLSEAGGNVRAQLQEAHPMKRLGQPNEVAQLVAYLASDEAAAITGSEFTVDGGFLAR
jgi:3(or 17)beta-hydroxysteroid dehydrogenase